MIGPAITALYARNLREGEVIPAGLGAEFRTFKIDPDWCWVVTDEDDNIIAVCLAANLHGLLYLVRLRALPDAPCEWAVPLLRRVFSDSAERGCEQYIAFLEDDRDAEQRLAAMVTHAGGMLREWRGVIGFGLTDVSLRGRRLSRCRKLFPLL